MHTPNSSAVFDIAALTDDYFYTNTQVIEEEVNNPADIDRVTVRPNDLSRFTLSSVDVGIAVLSNGAISGTVMLTGYRDGAAVTGATTSRSVNDDSTLTTFNVSANAAFHDTDYFVVSAVGYTVQGAFGIDNINANSFANACFLRGTLIATASRELPVEALEPGDVVRLHTGGVAEVRWVGRGRTLVTGRNRCRVAPVTVRAGALGPGMPKRDLHVTRDHALLVPGPDGDVLVPAGLLVNDVSVVWDERARVVEHYHVELAEHAVLIADGAPAESYRDDGAGHGFHNEAGRPADSPALPCYPLVTEGPALDHAWQAVVARQGRVARVETDPDVHIVADGRRVAARSGDGGVHVFSFDVAPGRLQLGSRSCVPASLGLGADCRRLGVPVARVVVRQGGACRTFAAGGFRDGFHAREPELQWTGGLADLPPELFQRGSGPVEVAVHLAAIPLRYRVAA